MRFMRQKQLLERQIAVLTDLSRISQREMLDGIFSYVRKYANWNVLPIQTSERFDPQALSHLSKDGLDGIITAESDNCDIERALMEKEIPIVVIGTRNGQVKCPPDARIGFIRIDDAEIGRFGAQRLSTLGRFASCAFVRIRKDAHWALLREKSFFEEFARHGNLIRRTFPDGDTPLEDWLVALPKPAALMAENDDTAKQVLDAAHLRKIPVPNSLAVIGADNDEFICNNSTPPLTSIHHDCHAIGYSAAELLAKLLVKRQSEPPSRIICSGLRLVDRESARPVVPAARVIRDALRFVAANATRGISPDDVAAHLKVSRRLLDLRFHEFSSCTVSEAIRNRQLEKVKELLRTTDHPVLQITSDCGFRDENYPKRLFRQRFGLSMRAWRKAQGADAAPDDQNAAL